MSRVERTESRESSQSRHAGHSDKNDSSRENATPRPTPTKAEGEASDVEQALEHQKE